MFSTTVVLFVAVWLPGLKMEELQSICDAEDMPCIRKHLTDNSNCNPAIFGTMPASYTAPDIRFQVPFFNISHIDQQCTAKNLDKCTVKSFARIKETGGTKLDYECEYVRIEALRAFILDDSGKQFIGTVIAEYDLVRFSIILYGKNLDVCRETCHAWTTIPTLFIKGQDSKSVQFFREDPYGIFGVNMPIWIREIWAVRGPLICEAIIDYTTCDYNCNYKKYL